MIHLFIMKLLAKWGGTFALVAGVGVGALVWDRNAVGRGVVKEQVRVEKIGEKTDANAQVARRKAEAKPHESLRGVCRDC